MKEYISFFKNTTKLLPYNYQIKVAELLLSGKNVILSVPTGAGKTWASVTPFLYAKQNEKTDFNAFSSRYVYCRVLFEKQGRTKKLANQKSCQPFLNYKSYE